MVIIGRGDKPDEAGQRAAEGRPRSKDLRGRPPGVPRKSETTTFHFLLIDGHGAMGPKGWSSARGRARTHARIRVRGAVLVSACTEWATYKAWCEYRSARGHWSSRPSPTSTGPRAAEHGEQPRRCDAEPTSKHFQMFMTCPYARRSGGRSRHSRFQPP
jgi:hypothetical protein